MGVLFPQGCFKAIMARQSGWAPGVTLSFDCDFPRDIEVLPRLLQLLEQYGYLASFACIGQWIKAFPQIHRQLVAAGHEILNHTNTHPNLYHPDYAYARVPGLNRARFNELEAKAKRTEILHCHETCVELLDYKPIGFRTPHFGVLHSEEVYPVLTDLGYSFSSSTMAADTADGLPWCRSDGIWEFPLSPCPHHPFGVFDSWHSLGKKHPAHAAPGAFNGLFEMLIGLVQQNGGYANIYFDPFAVMETGAMEEVLQSVQASGLPVWRYGDLLQQLKGPSVAAQMST
jgi:peptidoglycan/xylan/chitin deacetylase (PgdA/CDA1 family)